MGSRIGLLLGQALLLLLCFGYIEYVYYSNLRPDKHIKNAFKPTTCTIIKKRLSEKGRVVRKYRADFLISYDIKNATYNRWVSGNGLDMSYSQNKANQETLLQQFDIKQVYPCRYNPNLPQIAILVERHNWLAILPLTVPALIGIIVLYYFFQNVFTITTRVSTKTKKIVKKKKSPKSKKS